MKGLINFDDVNTKIITVREQSVILDSDVAKLYGVQTMRINEAVKNNLDKFPEGYIVQLNKEEWSNLISKNSISNSEESLRSKNSILNKQGRGKHVKYNPKAFTEKGLYMLATILKSERATQATIAIVEAFAKLKQLSNSIAFLNSMDPEVIEPEVIESTLQKTGGLLNELFFSAPPTSAEISVELNLGLLKAKRSVKSEKPIYQSEFDELKRMILELQNQIKK